MTRTTEDPRDYGLTAADLRAAADRLYDHDDTRLDHMHNASVTFGRTRSRLRSLADAIEGTTPGRIWLLSCGHVQWTTWTAGINHYGYPAPQICACGTTGDDRPTISHYIDLPAMTAPDRCPRCQETHD